MRWKFLSVTLLFAFILNACVSYPWRWSLTPPSHTEGYSWDTQDQLTEAEAQKFISDRVRALIHLSEPDPDPYSGSVALPGKCQRRNLPAVFQRSTDVSLSTAVAIYSSSAAAGPPVIGNCNNSPLLKTQYLFLYCKKTRRLFTLRYFYKDSMSWLTDPVAVCD